MILSVNTCRATVLRRGGNQQLREDFARVREPLTASCMCMYVYKEVPVSLYCTVCCAIFGQILAYYVYTAFDLSMY